MSRHRTKAARAKRRKTDEPKKVVEEEKDESKEDHAMVDGEKAEEKKKSPAKEEEEDESKYLLLGEEGLWKTTLESAAEEGKPSEVIDEKSVLNEKMKELFKKFRTASRFGNEVKQWCRT